MEWQNELRNALSGLATFAERFHEAVASALKNIDLPKWIEEWPEIERRLAKLPGDTQRVLKECTFPAINSFFTLGETRELVRVYDSEGKDAATKYLEGIAREALASTDARERLLAEWERRWFVEPRMPILREALQAHVEGKYSLSTPVFISQLEGVIAVAAKHKGQMGGKKYVAHVKKIVANEELVGAYAEQFVTDVLLQQFEHGTQQSFDLSRHAILHGGDVGYGTERNSIRAIVLFDYIQEVLATNEEGTESDQK